MEDVCLCMYVYVCVPVCKFTNRYVCMYVCMYACVCVCFVGGDGMGVYLEEERREERDIKEGKWRMNEKCVSSRSSSEMCDYSLFITAAPAHSAALWLWACGGI